MTSNIIWAKMKGFSSWPAEICLPPEHLQQPKNAENSKCVFFFGTHNYAWIESDNIYDYVQNKATFGLKNKSKKFRDAMQEADAAIFKQNEQLVNSSMPSAPKSEAKAMESVSLSPGIKKLTLKSVDISDLLKTFDDNKAMLQAIFDERRKILDRINCGNGYDYLTVLSRIASAVQQQQMYCCLCEAFAEKNYIENMRYENLFWTILLPEWLIAICAKQFSCSKEQVIAQIKEDDDDFLNAEYSQFTFDF